MTKTDQHSNKTHGPNNPEHHFTPPSSGRLAQSIQPIQSSLAQRQRDDRNVSWAASHGAGPNPHEAPDMGTVCDRQNVLAQGGSAVSGGLQKHARLPAVTSRRLAVACPVTFRVKRTRRLFSTWFRSRPW
ncbi:hypothetical protein DPEC_G00328830 [Dallia pectoralis]|uniref:Uncharacterized protein n=1 Tax=Dallia pectoralis TaxID=75939 RepID=A0ACC2F8R4_DALPE|nr:hypothetical protein DPEC_G00328830 [Dallia pectoralis]